MYKVRRRQFKAKKTEWGKALRQTGRKVYYMAKSKVTIWRRFGAMGRALYSLKIWSFFSRQ